MSSLELVEEVMPEPKNSKTVSKSVRTSDAGDDEEKKETVTIEVPTMGGDLDDFFSTKSIDQISDKVDVTSDDFDNIFCEAGDM